MDKKEINNIILKCIAFVGILFLIDRGYGALAYNLEKIATEKAPNAMLMEHTMWNVNADVVIIGSSEANHSYVCKTLQDTLGMTVQNCGRDGSGFLYQRCMINGLLKRYNPKMIIWAIYPTFLNRPDDLDIDRLSRLNPFYDTDSVCHKAVDSKSKYEKIKMLSMAYRYNSRLLTYLYKCLTPDYNFDKGYAPLNRQKKGFRLKNADYEGELDDGFLNQFCETIKDCSSKGVKVALVITPRFEKGNFKEYKPYAEIVKTASAYSNVFVLDDYYQASDFLDKNMYADNAHLLNEGAIKFSSILSVALKKIIKNE